MCVVAGGGGTWREEEEAKEEIGETGVLGQASIPGPGRHLPVSRLLPHLWVQLPHPRLGQEHTGTLARFTGQPQSLQRQIHSCLRRRRFIYLQNYPPEKKILYNNTQSK